MRELAEVSHPSAESDHEPFGKRTQSRGIAFVFQTSDQAHCPDFSLPTFEDGNNRSVLKFLEYVAGIEVHGNALMVEQQLLQTHLVMRHERVFPVNRRAVATDVVQNVRWVMSYGFKQQSGVFGKVFGGFGDAVFIQVFGCGEHRRGGAVVLPNDEAGIIKRKAVGDDGINRVCPNRIRMNLGQDREFHIGVVARVA